MQMMASASIVRSTSYMFEMKVCDSICDCECIMCVCCRMAALHQAALVGNMEILRMLLENGAAVDVKDSKGGQPQRQKVAAK